MALHNVAYERILDLRKFIPKFIEIPRQQEEESGEPEVMQFKATQKLLNPTQISRYVNFNIFSINILLLFPVLFQHCLLLMKILMKQFWKLLKGLILFFNFWKHLNCRRKGKKSAATKASQKRVADKLSRTPASSQFPTENGSIPVKAGRISKQPHISQLSTSTTPRIPTSERHKVAVIKVGF